MDLNAQMRMDKIQKYGQERVHLTHFWIIVKMFFSIDVQQIPHELWILNARWRKFLSIPQ